MRCATMTSQGRKESALRRALLFSFVFLFGLVPGSVLAHGDEDHSGSRDAVEVLLNGFYHLEADETAGTVVVVNDDALVEGTVEDILIIVNGSAVVAGSVEGSIFVINGSLHLVAGAAVEDDVILISSDIVRDTATTVGGDIDTRSGWFLTGGVGFLIGFVLWVWFAGAVLTIAFLFAAVAGRQLSGAASAMVERPGYTWLGVVILWAVGGTAVTALFASIVGIGAALAMILLFMPVLLLLGFVVAGMWVGRFVIGLFDRTPSKDHPYLAVLSGVGVLALVALIPIVGALVAFVATLWGTGALAHQGWMAFRGPQPDVTVEAVSLS